MIPLGGLGCFDEHGIFPMNVSCVTATRSTATPAAGAGGFGVGGNRHRLGHQPRRRPDLRALSATARCLAASLHEPCLVGDGFVKVIDGVFHMWYIFGTGWKRYAPDAAPDRTYKIGHATFDGRHRMGQGRGAPDHPGQLGPGRESGAATVIEIDGRYHMFFCYRESFDFRKRKGRGYRIGHAWSDDLVELDARRRRPGA